MTAALAAGCGDGGDPNSAGGSQGELTTSSLSKDEYVKKANALCSRSKREMLKEIAKFTPTLVKKNPGKVIPAARNFPEQFRVVLLPAIESQVDAMRRLGAPVGEEEEVESIVVSMQEAVNAANANLPASSEQFLRVFRPAGDLAREYGIDACAFG